MWGLRSVTLILALGFVQTSCFAPHCDPFLEPGCCNSGTDSLELTTTEYLDLDDYLANGLANDDSPSMNVKVYESVREEENLVGEVDVEFLFHAPSGQSFTATSLDLENEGSCHFGAVVVFELEAPDSWDPWVEEQFETEIIDYFGSYCL